MPLYLSVTFIKSYSFFFFSSSDLNSLSWLQSFQSISLNSYPYWLIFSLSWTGILEGTSGERNFVPPSWIWFRNVLRQSHFSWRVVLCYGENSGYSSQWFLCPSPCQTDDGVFLGSSQWEPAGVAGGKAHKHAEPPSIRLQSPGSP